MTFLEACALLKRYRNGEVTVISSAEWALAMEAVLLELANEIIKEPR